MTTIRELKERFDRPARPCSCGHSDPRWLHTQDCERLIDIVDKYKPGGYSIENGRVVRPLPPELAEVLG